MPPHSKCAPSDPHRYFWRPDPIAAESSVRRARTTPRTTSPPWPRRSASATASPGRRVTRVFERERQILGAAVTCGKWLRILAVDRDARRQGIGTALLRERDAVIFAEPGNYFTPGVLDTDEGDDKRSSSNEATRKGSHDLESRSRSRRTSKATAHPARTHDDADRVLAFVEREFGRIWRFEAAKAFEREMPPAFIAEDDGEITGFAVHDVNNRGLGFFGPTGVAKSMRGQRHRLQAAARFARRSAPARLRARRHSVDRRARVLSQVLWRETGTSVHCV